MTQILHYFALVCLTASLLIRVLPAPSEIDSKAYAVVYGIIRRASLNLPLAPNSPLAPNLPAAPNAPSTDLSNTDSKKG